MLDVIEAPEVDYLTDRLNKERANTVMRSFPDLTTHKDRTDKLELTPEEKAERYQRSLDECGRKMIVPNGRNGWSLRWKFCHHTADCPHCQNYYKAEALKDLEAAANNFGGLWVIGEDVDEEKWRSVKYQIDRAKNARLKSMRANANSKQEGRYFDLFYLKVPLADNKFTVAVACKDMPETKRIDNWQKVDLSSVRSELLYTPHGHKSGRLSKYRKYFGEYHERVAIKVHQIEESEDITDTVLNQMFARASVATMDLHLLAEIAIDKESELQYRIELIERQSKLVVEYLAEEGYEVHGQIIYTSYLVSDLIQLE